MTEEKIEALAKKFCLETGRKYSVCRLSAEEIADIFEGVNEDNLWQKAKSICEAMPKEGPTPPTWTAVFNAGLKQTVGLMSYAEALDIIKGAIDYN